MHTAARERARSRKNKTIALAKQSIPLKDIAVRVGVSMQSIRQYLRAHDPKLLDALALRRRKPPRKTQSSGTDFSTPHLHVKAWWPPNLDPDASWYER